MRLTLASLLVLASTCNEGTEPPRPLTEGTWGGENAAVIVLDTVVHIHIGCTYGNAPPPPSPGVSEGRFELTGTYNIDAHPVNLGIFHPARISGEVSGRWMIVSVALQDTNVTLGPVSVMLGREPTMQACPICRTVGQR
jgi:hypothetical protein